MPQYVGKVRQNCKGAAAGAWRYTEVERSLLRERSPRDYYALLILIRRETSVLFEKLEHVALSVADLERSMAFYRDIIGFEVKRILEPDAGLPQAKVVALEGAKTRIAHLELGGVMLELFQYLHPEGRPISEDFTQADHGFTHISLKSTDTRADYEYLRERGVRFYSEPVEFRPGVWICFFYGPDGETVEIRQT